MVFMKQSLIDLIFLSRKRKQLLLFLNKNPGTRDEIRDLLQISPASVRPQLKIMKDSGLIVEEKNSYELSKVGKVLVGKMQDFLGAAELFEDNFEYWAKRDLSVIPPFLRDRIEELGHCELFEPGPAHMFETPLHLAENLLESKEVLTFVSYFHPEAPFLYEDLVKRGVELKLCMTEEVAGHLFREYPEEAGVMQQANNSKLSICRRPVKLPSIVVTDRFMVLKLYEKDGKPRDQLLISSEERALSWGRELFMYYRELSEPIFK